MTPRKKAESGETKPAPAKRTRQSAKKAAPKRAAKPKQAKPNEPAVPEPEADSQAESMEDPIKETDSQGGVDQVEAPDPESVSVPEPDAPIAGFSDRVVAFYLGGQRYALPIDRVQEIQQIVAFSEIPAQGGAVVGMVNLRGEVIPALDMRLLVGLPREEYRLETPMIVCRASGQLVSLIVDEVQDVVAMPEGCLQEAPKMHALSSKMVGVCRMDNDLVYILDIERIVAPGGASL